MHHTTSRNCRRNCLHILAFIISLKVLSIVSIFAGFKKSTFIHKTESSFDLVARGSRRCDQPHRVSPHSGCLPCNSEFFRWPLRSLAIRMRSQYTSIYYRKSPVPSSELYTNTARSLLTSLTHKSICHPAMCPRTPRPTHILPTNYPRPPYDTPHGS